MILKYRQRPLKLIPRKYADIRDLTDYLEDFEHRRLAREERQALDQALFQQAARPWLRSLQQTEPLVYEQIDTAHPVMVYQVTTNDGQVYYSVKLSNGISVRCPKLLFDLSPTKGRVKYAAQLSPQIAPPVCYSSAFLTYEISQIK